MSNYKKKDQLPKEQYYALRNLWVQQVRERGMQEFPRIFTEMTGIRVMNGVCKCAFHEDKTPSMTVSDKGFHCFKTGCGGNPGGDVFKFVMLREAVNFNKAVEIVGEMVGISPPQIGDQELVRKAASYKPRKVEPPKEELPKDYLKNEELKPSSLLRVPRNFAGPDVGREFRIFSIKELDNGAVVKRVESMYPKMVHNYRDIHGARLCTVVRIEQGMGAARRKSYRQIHMAPADEACPKHLTVNGYTWVKGLPAKGERKPIYGAESLKAWLEIPEEKRGGILVVEGEKCVDYAKLKLEDRRVLVLSVMGGLEGALYADWKPLMDEIRASGTKSVRVFTWPDADAPVTRKQTGTVIEPQKVFVSRIVNGMMRDLTDDGALRQDEIPAMVFYNVKPPADKDGGWDIADAIDEGWSRDQLIAHIKNAAVKVEALPEFTMDRPAPEEPDHERSSDYNGPG